MDGLGLGWDEDPLGLKTASEALGSGCDPGFWGRGGGAVDGSGMLSINLDDELCFLGGVGSVEGLLGLALAGITGGVVLTYSGRFGLAWLCSDTPLEGVGGGVARCGGARPFPSTKEGVGEGVTRLKLLKLAVGTGTTGDPLTDSGMKFLSDLDRELGVAGVDVSVP